MSVPNIMQFCETTVLRNSCAVHSVVITDTLALNRT